MTFGRKGECGMRNNEYSDWSDYEEFRNGLDLEDDDHDYDTFEDCRYRSDDEYDKLCDAVSRTVQLLW
jgi:hypothetical protein